MGSDPRNDASEQNWRLQVELDVPSKRGGLEKVVGSLRDPALVTELETQLPHDVVITHDGDLLFAYAADQASIQATRDAVESTTARDGITVRSIRVSHWDSVVDDWRQIDPPAVTTQQQEADETAERNAATVETRTLVANVGREIRTEFERSLSEWASELGVQCNVIEQHPHLLTSQVGFTITGPKRKLDEFADGLRAEERATIRTETTVMLSPL